MKKVNNLIITLSGDPASGKGTVAKELENQYKEKGYKVHIISVGSLFRKVAIREYKKMFPDVQEPSIEEINSNPSFAEKLKEIDTNFDTEIERIGKEINTEERPEEVFIIDSRMAWYMIPESFAVRLTVDSKTAGERAFNDKTREPEDRYSSVEEAIEDTESRKQEEIERYKNQYKVDLTDNNNFKLIIGTTLADTKEIAATIIKCQEYDSKGKYFAKKWASPELFYPTQGIRATMEKKSEDGLTLDEISKSIKENGIYIDEPVDSTIIDGSPYQFVANGHHRVFGSIKAGKTLIPYMVIEQINRATVQDMNELSKIYDHEDNITKPNGENIRYAKYPEIDKESEFYDEWYR